MFVVACFRIHQAGIKSERRIVGSAGGGGIARFLCGKTLPVKHLRFVCGGLGESAGSVKGIAVRAINVFMGCGPGYYLMEIRARNCAPQPSGVRFRD